MIDFKGRSRSLTDIDALAARVKTEFDTFDLLFVNAGLGFFASGEHDRGNCQSALKNKCFAMSIQIVVACMANGPSRSPLRKQLHFGTSVPGFRGPSTTSGQLSFNESAFRPQGC